MLNRTLVNMTQDVRNRSGLGDSQFRTNLQIARYLNEANRQLTSRLIALYGQDWRHKNDTISTKAGEALYDMPADCFVAKFFRVTLDGYRIDIPRAGNDDIDTEVSAEGWSAGSTDSTNVRHRMQGRQVRFTPTPIAVHTVTVHYVPTAVAWEEGYGSADDAEIDEMSADTDYIDSRFGWEEWVVIKAAIKVKTDQEEDITALKNELDELWQDIENTAGNRVTGSPEKIRSSYEMP